MLDAREIMELQKLSGMDKFSKLTVKQALDREKLIELIGSTEYGNGSLIGNNFQKGFIEKIADHLIANGVTLATDNNVGDKTKADRIRAMSDKELKYIARAVIKSLDCPMEGTECTDCVFHGLCVRGEYYYNNEEEWLKQPVGE